MRRSGKSRPGTESLVGPRLMVVDMVALGVVIMDVAVVAEAAIIKYRSIL